MLEFFLPSLLPLGHSFKAGVGLITHPKHLASHFMIYFADRLMINDNRQGKQFAFNHAYCPDFSELKLFI